MDDAALIRGTLAGRREDFDALVERYQKPLYRFAYRLVRDHEHAADVVQMTFPQAYTHLAQFAGRASFKTWIHQIALNRCRTLLRTECARPSVPLGDVNEVRLAEASFDTASLGHGSRAMAGDAAGEPAGDADCKAALERAIGRLPLRQRAVVSLRVFSDLPIKEIARLEGISENAAKVNYHHAVTRLRQWLQEKDT